MAISFTLNLAIPGNFWTGTGAPPWSVVRGPGINLGEWEHLAGVCSDGKQTLYVNGELAGETDAVVNVNAEQELLIGAGANERATHEYLFNGKIDEVILYNRALSADEIAAVMERESLTAVQPRWQTRNHLGTAQKPITLYEILGRGSPGTSSVLPLPYYLFKSEARLYIFEAVFNLP